MPSEPRLFSASLNPPDEGFQLPDKLAALADQLAADAAYLSARYPANPRAANLAMSERPSLRRLWWSAAAALVAIAAGISAWQLRSTRDARNEITALARDDQLDEVRAARPAGMTTSQPAAAVAGSEDEVFQEVRNVLEGFSGAEREAVLDLLEQQPATPPEISI